MEDIQYQQNEIWLNKGDILYLHTDGVTEATDSENNLYGEERLQSILNSIDILTPNSILESVKNDIDVFVNDADQFDDITMCCLKICKGSNSIIFPAVLDKLQEAIGFIENILELNNFTKESQLQGISGSRSSGSGCRRAGARSTSSTDLTSCRPPNWRRAADEERRGPGGRPL